MLFFFCADANALGRVDKANLSELQVMDLFFTPANPAITRRQLGGDESDPCTWEGVRCYGGDAVKVVRWYNLNIVLEGKIDFTMIPRNALTVEMTGQIFTGEVSTAYLPPGIRRFVLSMCRFTGTLDMGGLPSSLTALIVTKNNLTGIVNVCDLPVSLEECEYQEWGNETREVHIGKLPANALLLNFMESKIEALTFEDAQDSNRVFI